MGVLFCYVLFWFLLLDLTGECVCVTAGWISPASVHIPAGWISLAGEQRVLSSMSFAGRVLITSLVNVRLVAGRLLQAAETKKKKKRAMNLWKRQFTHYIVCMGQVDMSTNLHVKHGNRRTIFE